MVIGKLSTECQGLGVMEVSVATFGTEGEELDRANLQKSSLTRHVPSPFLLLSVWNLNVPSGAPVVTQDPETIS